MCKGNNRGVGFIRIPANERGLFRINDNFRVSLHDGKEGVCFYGRIKDYSGLGIYVPKDIMTKNNLMNKEFRVLFERIDGFYTSLDNGGRFHIPKNTFEDLCLKHNEILFISAKIDDNKIEKFCRAKKFVYKNGSVNFSCGFGPEFSHKRGIFKIERKISLPSKTNEIIGSVRDMDIGLDGDKAIVFGGNKVPIMLNTKIRLNDIAYYIGHFFADGTKKGNSWGICISTFEQANKFLELHKRIIIDANPNIELSFTNRRDNSGYLKDMWERNLGIEIQKIRFNKSDTLDSRNRNKFGTLVLREHRKLTQDVYNKLIKTILEHIRLNSDRELAIDFICGVLEGDGSPSAKKNGHILISTNKNDSVKLEEVLEITGIEFKVFREGKTNRYYIRIGALGILRNLPILKDKIFKYYPKRRIKFIERFIGIGTNQYIMGKQSHASAWVKAYLRDNKILDDRYNLTGYGKEIRTCLEDMEKELKE